MPTRPAVILEITPPREVRPAVLLRRARALGSRASAVNVIQRGGRWSSLEASILLADAGLQPVWHLANRGRSERAIRADFERAASSALPAVLCLRGESGPEEAGDTPKIRECVSLARLALPAARVGVTLNPYLPGEGVWKNLFAKLEAGAHFVQTQPIFAAGVLEPFADAIGKSFPHVAIVPMVMPLADATEARRMAQRLRVPIPHEAVGTAGFAHTLRRLAHDPRHAGVAVMTPRMDPDPATLRGIGAALDTLP